MKNEEIAALLVEAMKMLLARSEGGLESIRKQLLASAPAWSSTDPIVDIVEVTAPAKLMRRGSGIERLYRLVWAHGCVEFTSANLEVKAYWAPDKETP